MQLEAVADESARVIAQLAAAAEKRPRSLPMNGLVTAACVVAALTSVALSDTSLLGSLTPARAAAIIGTWGLIFEAANVAFWWLGPTHVVARAASVLDEMGRSASLMVMLSLSGSAALIFYIASLLRGFAWHPVPVREVWRGVAANFVSHAVVAAVCLQVGRAENAALVMLAFSAWAIGRGMTGHSLARSVRARVERDLLERELLRLEVSTVRERIAREIHDGIGADVMALLLELRRSAQSEVLAGEAQEVLDDLRTVVWSLRSGGTIAEMGKLLDATCRRLCPKAYTRSSSPALALQPVGGGASLSVLHIARALVGCAAARTGLTRVNVELGLHGGAISLVVEADGISSGPNDSLLAQARAAVDETSGTLELTDDGRCARATVPLASSLQMRQYKSMS